MGIHVPSTTHAGRGGHIRFRRNSENIGRARAGGVVQKSHADTADGGAVSLSGEVAESAKRRVLPREHEAQKRRNVGAEFT